MLPGNAKIVKCPFCGAEKELMTLLSGNTIGAQYWSDNKRIAPMLPSVSPVQKCPHCGKYYLEWKQPSKEIKECSFERGEISFQEWREAYSQFVSEDLDRKTLTDINFWTVQSYNDCFYRNHGNAPTDDDFTFFKKMAQEFIDSFNWEPVKHPLLKAELYREMGEMDSCKATLDEINFDELEDFEKYIFNEILKRMKSGDIRVFKMNI